MGVEYHRRSWIGHGTVIINIGQPVEFAVSNSAPITHFTRPSENPPWHNGYNQTDIAEFGPMLTQIWFIMAQLYREAAIMN